VIASVRVEVPGETIGEKLHNARELRGLSLREVSVATGAGVTAAGLSRIERGHRYPSLRTLEHVLHVLGGRLEVNGRELRLELELRQPSEVRR
jgi:transcriptional regulator with XRE-family HTH domain